MKDLNVFTDWEYTRLQGRSRMRVLLFLWYFWDGVLFAGWMVGALSDGVGFADEDAGVFWADVGFAGTDNWCVLG